VGLCPKRRKNGGGFVDGLKRQSCLGLCQHVMNIVMELADSLAYRRRPWTVCPLPGCSPSDAPFNLGLTVRVITSRFSPYPLSNLSLRSD
jgi:hypothetical protein